MVKICWHCMKTEETEKVRCDCRRMLQPLHEGRRYEIQKMLNDKGYKVESFFILTTTTRFTNGARINFETGINIPSVPITFIKENVDREHRITIYTSEKNTENEILDILYDWTINLPQFYIGMKTTVGDELKYLITMEDAWGNSWGCDQVSIGDVVEVVTNNINKKGYTLFDAFAYYPEDQETLDEAIKNMDIKIPCTDKLYETNLLKVLI